MDLLGRVGELTRDHWLVEIFGPRLGVTFRLLLRSMNPLYWTIFGVVCMIYMLWLMPAIWLGRMVGIPILQGGGSIFWWVTGGLFLAGLLEFYDELRFMEENGGHPRSVLSDRRWAGQVTRSHKKGTSMEDLQSTMKMTMAEIREALSRIIHAQLGFVAIAAVSIAFGLSVEHFFPVLDAADRWAGLVTITRFVIIYGVPTICLLFIALLQGPVKDMKSALKASGAPIRK